jgi:hypothetical protein
MDSDLRRRTRDAIGFSADLLGIVVIAIAIAPALTAVVTGSIAWALVLLCGLLAVAALYLLLRLRKISRDRTEMRYAYERLWHWGIEVDENLRQAGNPDDAKPKKSLWLPNRRDLRSLAISATDFMQCKDAVSSLASKHIGSKAFYVQLNAVTLRLAGVPAERYDSPVVHMQAVSVASRRLLLVDFRGSTKAVTNQVFREEYFAREPSERADPWVTDATWLDLVHQASARMEPFDGSVMLYAMPRDIAGSGRLWRITFRSTRSDQGISTLAIVTFGLHKGALAEIAGA